MSLVLDIAPENFTTPDGRPITIRTCHGSEELESCVDLQIAAWGFPNRDLVPRRTFVVAQHIGGQVIGAFDDGRLVGFAMALPGVRGVPHPEPYLHSYMLAVAHEYRDSGVGRRLKLYQRDQALARNLERMEWTFDPLEIKNAFLNIHRLGVVVRRYTANFYGVSSSRLQGGLPSDRLHAEWYLRSARVEGILQGNSPGSPKIEETIVVPRLLQQWRSSEDDLPRALAVQAENRERFQSAFARGLAVTGFARDEQGNGIFELAAWTNPSALDPKRPEEGP